MRFRAHLAQSRISQHVDIQGRLFGACPEEATRSSLRLGNIWEEVAAAVMATSDLTQVCILLFFTSMEAYCRINSCY